MRGFAARHPGLLTATSLILFLGACAKKPAPVSTQPSTPTPVPVETKKEAPPAPTIELQASPASIERGDQTTLQWNSHNANSVVIDNGVGNVAESGSIVVSPRESTTYTATASGPGGDTRASARVTVVAPAAQPTVTSEDIQQSFEQNVKPVFFDYDKSDLRPDAKKTLEENARWLRQHQDINVIIEGHCDERGTEEYNLALGDRRAQSAKNYLVELGVEASRLETISYGEERPFALGHDEAAWALNRRAHFRLKR